ncbi:MAG: hypothetical protein ABI983_06415 [Acidobacteriota bacterium]
MRSLKWVGAGLAAITIVFALIAVHFSLPPRRLPAITSPTFAHVDWPPAQTGLRTMDEHLRRAAGHEDLGRLVPDQAGVFWIAIVVLLIAGIDYSRPFHPRNFDLIASQAAAWFFWDLLKLFEETQAPEYLSYMRTMFTATVLVSLWLAVRAVWIRLRPYADRWQPAASDRALAGVAIGVTVLSLATVFLRSPDDSSYFSNLGGQRLRETGMLPYGDPLLTGTPGAAYAPGMYFLHAGMQSLLMQPANIGTDDLSLATLNDASGYMEPSPIVTQLLLAIFQLVAVTALALIGLRWQGISLAAALVALYGSSAAVLGVGGDRDSLMGVTFVSHVIPPAMTLVAFGLIEQPLVSGAGLAVAAWTGFYPAFFAPIWLGWHATRDWKPAARFVIGFAAVSVPMLAYVLMRSRPASGLGLVATIVRDTFGHHTDLAGYGSSPFGLWGQATGITAFFGSPLVGQSPFTAPFFLLFLAFLAWAGWMARSATLPGLALLTAAAGIGATVWKVHATATYIAWFYPFLLLGLLGTPPPATLPTKR